MKITHKVLLKKYKNISAPMKASLWFVICSCLQKGISVITVPIFTRILTPEQYGVYSVYQSWYSIVLVFATLYLYAGVFNNGMLKFENDRDSFQSSLIGLSFTVTSILTILYLLFHEFWNNLFGMNTLLIVAMLIECFCSVGFSFWSARQRFDYKYKKLIIVTLTSSIIAPILGVIGVLLATNENKAEFRILAYVLVQIIFGGYICIQSFRKGRKFYSFEYWKYALSFNLPLIPHYLSQTVLNQADRIMISKMVGSDKAAIYSVAYSSAMLMTIFTQSINNSFVPWTYKAIKDRNYLSLRNVANALLILVGGISLILVLFAPELIYILAGDEYVEAVKIIPSVAGAVFFMFLYPLFCNIEFYFEKTKFIMVASSLAAVLNIALNYYAIGKFGYLAAGYTTLICFIIICIAHYLFMIKVCNQNSIPLSIYDFKFILLFSIGYLVIILLISFTYDHMFFRYFIIITLLILAFWKKEYIINIFKKIRNK